MKINIIPTTKLALLCTAVCATMLAFSPNARALTIDDAHELGYVQFGIQSGDGVRLSYVNNFVGMAFSTNDKANGQTYTCPHNVYCLLDSTSSFGDYYH